MEPTQEQTAALELFATGKNLAIEAGAGTGKTTTLQLLGESSPKRCQYVAFNKAIVVDAGNKMPANVNASTAHSLAFRAVGRRYAHRLKSQRMTSSQVARELGIDSFVVTTKMEKKTLAAGYLGGLVMKAVGRFCQSADAEPAPRHVPYVDGIDVPTGDGRRGMAANIEVRKYLMPFLAKAWDDMVKVDGRLRFSHDCYLKIWQLSSPRIHADVIFFDEAQDAAPVMLDIVQQQTHAQLVYVGDSQQQIYEWRGAVNALDSCRESGAETTYLSQSFRFGQPVADVANMVLALLDADLRLTGTPSIASTVEALSNPDAVLCRTNAGAVRRVLDAIDEGKKAHLVGGGGEVVRFARGAQELQTAGSTSHPELACFSSWGEVQSYVQDDPQGEELRLMVDLLDRYGIQTIIDALDTNTNEDEADVIVSTAHKSKGREWERVQLADDFAKPDKEMADLGDGELRLLYVAATRARCVLDVEQCAPLAQLLFPDRYQADVPVSGITDMMAGGRS